MEVLREEEEQRIRAIYRNHIRLINDDSFLRTPRAGRLYLNAAFWILIFILLILFWQLAILLALLYLLNAEKTSTDKEKFLVELGFNSSEVNREGWLHPKCLGDYYHLIWSYEADFVISYLKKLPMELDCREQKFGRMIHCNNTIVQLRDRDQANLHEIFRRVKQRADMIDIPMNCRCFLTPAALRKRIFSEWIAEVINNESQDQNSRHFEGDGQMTSRLKNISDILERIDNRSRVMGGDVIEIEDELAKCHIPSVTNKMILNSIEVWRRYKIVEDMSIIGNRMMADDNALIIEYTSDCLDWIQE